MPVISILIVSYNTAKQTVAAVGSALAEAGEVAIEVVVVDNASTDGSVAALEAAFGGDERVKVVALLENLGFAGGNNEAAQHGRGDMVLLLNPDTLVDEDGIASLWAFSQARPEAGVWGGLSRLADGRRDPGTQQSLPTLRNVLLETLGLRRFAGRKLPEGAAEPAEVDVTSGAFMMLRRSDWETLGGFDTGFFLYSEEVDLCERVRRDLGKPVLMTPNAAIVHHVGASSAGGGERWVRILRGRMHYARKHHPGAVWLFGVLYLLHALLRCVATMPKALASPAVENRWWRAVRKAPSWWWGFR